MLSKLSMTRKSTTLAAARCRNTEQEKKMTNNTIQKHEAYSQNWCTFYGLQSRISRIEQPIDFSEKWPSFMFGILLGYRPSRQRRTCIQLLGLHREFDEKKLKGNSQLFVVQVFETMSMNCYQNSVAQKLTNLPHI